MNASKLFVSVVALVAFVALMTASVSAEFANIRSVTVNGIEMFDQDSGNVAAVFAGETIPVRVIFDGVESANDTRVVARLFGGSEFSQVTERFDIVPHGTYSRLLNVKVPSDIDPNERNVLEISIESRNEGEGDSRTIQLEVQRSSYDVEVLSVSNDDKARAGKALPLDIVLKNRGRQFAEDTYVRVTIPQLGISTVGYFGDLSPEDQGGDVVDKEDAVERRLFLNIPSNVPAGVYTMEIEAYNTDASTRVSKRIVVTGAQDDSSVVSSATAKSFGVGETQRYTVTLVNTGDTVQVYELTLDNPDGLTINLDDSVAVVPAGSSKTVAFDVSSSKKGTYNFAVEVRSNDELVNRASYVANVTGRGSIDATILVTVVLAIIFIVLVIVLIVLLTRKPARKEEFGESYY